jgi:hypothetical protein
VDGILYTFGLAANDSDGLGFDSIGVSLTGTGTNVSAFTWSGNATITPGEPNDGQTLGTGPTHMDPPLLMHMTIVNNNVQIITHGNTNAWDAAPYYTTNLMVDAPQWLSITPFQNTHSGSTNTLSFTAPAATNAFYHIKFSP